MKSERSFLLTQFSTEGMPLDRKRICIVATIPMPLVVFMAPHIGALSQIYDVTLVANGKIEEVGCLLNENVHFVPIRIERKISIFRDLVAFCKLLIFFRRQHFDCVQSIMPKSGLLAMLAAKIAGVSIRVHFFTGQVWVTCRGFLRFLLKTLDRILVICATEVLADSKSQMNFLITEKIAPSEKIRVLGHGSVCGVDTMRFKPSQFHRQVVRNRFDIPLDAIVALYLGRLNQEKGMFELALSFAKVAEQHVCLHLLVVGIAEGKTHMKMIELAGGALNKMHFVGFSAEPEIYMAAADFFILPSHREGFGSTILEAAACSIPSIGSRIYGITDAIVEDETGLLVPVRDVDALAAAMIQLTRDVELRHRLGDQALKRVLKYYKSEYLTVLFLDYYKNLFSRKI